MKLTTWNVNSLRARLTHVVGFVRQHAPDVLCLQETKVTDALFPRELLEGEGYHVLCFGQKGYHGVAILSRLPVADVVRGLPGDPPDAARRALGCIVGGLMVLNLYVPNGQAVGTESWRHKLDWLRRLRCLLDARYSAADKVAVLGDFNVAPEDRDVHDPAAWRERIMCSTPERAALRQVMAFGLDDLLRVHRPEPGIYTWWDYQAGSAARNAGLRIDHLLTTPPLTRACTAVVVHRDLRLQQAPSDHAPVTGVFAQ